MQRQGKLKPDTLKLGKREWKIANQKMREGERERHADVMKEDQRRLSHAYIAG